MGDDLLRLIFTACHPVLSPEARAGAHSAIARRPDHRARLHARFWLAEPTIAQRIVRAKRTLREAQVPFEVPRGPKLAARLSSVLGAIYLIFNEGYSADGGRRLDAARALRGRAPAGAHPGRTRAGEPEVHGLVALMEIQASRSRRAWTRRANRFSFSNKTARVGSAPDPSRFGRAGSRTESKRAAAAGPYALQAAIVACHARARAPKKPTGSASPRFTANLRSVTPSPVVELNRAVAIAMASGQRPACELVDALISEPSLQNYHLLPSVRGDFLFKLGRFDEARAEFRRAASLTRNTRERDLLLERARLTNSLDPRFMSILASLDDVLIEPDKEMTMQSKTLYGFGNNSFATDRPFTGRCPPPSSCI